LRNALAELAIAGLDDQAAAAAVAWLATPAGPPPPAASARLAHVHLVDPGAPALLAVHAPYAAAVAAHATRARAARAALAERAGRPAGSVEGALERAAVLWNAGLFFEVHEVLEAVWKSAAGAVRQALQGVIQIAVAYHHLAHDNRRGARTLLTEGRERLRSVPVGTLSPLDVPALLAATAAWEDALETGAPAPGAPPRLALGA
jgi:hypothetical protein